MGISEVLNKGRDSIQICVKNGDLLRRAAINELRKHHEVVTGASTVITTAVLSYREARAKTLAEELDPELQTDRTPGLGGVMSRIGTTIRNETALFKETPKGPIIKAAATAVIVFLAKKASEEINKPSSK
ncbi:MAG: hypothetical protein ABH816_03785 [Candidatus Levyibacteriota bacterium]